MPQATAPWPARTGLIWTQSSTLPIWASAASPAVIAPSRQPGTA